MRYLMQQYYQNICSSLETHLLKEAMKIKIIQPETKHALLYIILRLVYYIWMDYTQYFFFSNRAFLLFKHTFLLIFQKLMAIEGLSSGLDIVILIQKHRMTFWRWRFVNILKSLRNFSPISFFLVYRMILSGELVFVEIKKNININPQSSANLNRHQERNIQFFRFTFKKYVLVLYFIKKNQYFILNT